MEPLQIAALIVGIVALALLVHTWSCVVQIATEVRASRDDRARALSLLERQTRLLEEIVRGPDGGG